MAGYVYDGNLDETYTEQRDLLHLLRNEETDRGEKGNRKSEDYFFFPSSCSFLLIFLLLGSDGLAPVIGSLFHAASRLLIRFLMMVEGKR